MIPKASFFEGFTNEGRIKKLWTQAVAEPDLQVALNKLREVRRRLYENPAELNHLWLPFIDTFFGPAFLNRLTNQDVLAVEDMGNALASGVASPLRPEDIWFRVLKAHADRAQEALVRALLARIYFSLSANWEEKVRCARDLAHRRDMSEQSSRVYIDYLCRTPGPAAEQEMLKLLSEMCAVDFTTDKAGLERAWRVAQHLVSRNIPIQVAGLWNALGLYTYLIQGMPAQAVQYFSNALNVNLYDRMALIGILACWIHLGQYNQVSAMARQPLMQNFAKDPIVVGLLQFSGMLAWLNDPGMVGPLPGNVEVIESVVKMGLRTYLGDIVDATLGRFYLLAGDAQRASALLLPLLGTNPQHPQWVYYAAWAEMLIGNSNGVAYCFGNSAQWSGRWVVACLLVDTDATLAEKSGAFSYLRGILSSPRHVKESYLPLIQARLALAQSSTPIAVVWKRDTSSIEEDLEGLRTIMGYTYYCSNIVGLGRWLTHPLFARLPLADQLLWRGLFGISAKDQVQQGLAFLHEAATRYRYYRAALVLSLHYLEQHRIFEAKRFLQIVSSIRDDGRTAFLQAYIAGREGEMEVAIKQFDQATSESSVKAKAFYATGNLFLQKACQAMLSGQSGQVQQYRKQAVESLSSALLSGKDRLPGQAETIFHCAQFVAQPEQQSLLGASLWNELERLDPQQRQPWLKWNAILGCLWYGKPDDVISLASEIYPIVDSANRIEGNVAEVFAQALAVVSTRAEQIGYMGQLLQMLERFSTRSQRASIKQACQVGITLTLREHYKKADFEQRRQIRQELMRCANADRSNDTLALLLAATSVENGAKLVAINTLRNTTSKQSSLQELFPYLADVLDQSGQVTHSTPEPGSDSSLEMQRAYEVLHIAEAFTRKEPERGYEILNGLLHQHGGELASLVKIGSILPHMCVYAKRAGGTVPPIIIETLRSFASAPMEDEQRILLARCAAAIGDLDVAENLWEESLKREQQPSKQLCQEYVRFLSHQAVKAHLSGNNLEATRYLRQAAGWLK